jgi:hypothetical protein
VTVAYVIMGLCVVLGVPFTLWWWKEADRWASAEHRKFKPKPKEDLSDAVVVKWDRADTDHATDEQQNP